MYRNFDDIVARAKELGPGKAAVLFPDDPDVMLSVSKGIEAGLIAPVMVGHKDRILSVAREINLPLDHIALLDERDPQKASDLCLDMAAEKEVDFVVKGKILSSYPYRTLVRKTKNLAPDQTSSSICFHQIPGLDKVFITTDPGIHILPDLEAKKKILANALHASRQLGCSSPQVMALAADHVDGTLSHSAREVDALRRFAEDGGLGPCRILKATNLYGLFCDMEITSTAFPDIFLVSNIETGNILCKTIDHIMRGIRQCIAVGAGMTILAPSRSDPYEVRIKNLALGPVLTLTLHKSLAQKH
jgi:phosphate butyryltransferase